MKILIASGSFKDVFNPIEACDVIEGALNHKENEIKKLPICDGGEYTYEVLRKYCQYDEEIADNILNAYGKPVRARYLTKENEAHLISSEIIRLFPEEDMYKNPLELTDFGFGQLFRDAVAKGYCKIKLYIGGTSTVCCGMGFAQALGVRLYDCTGREFEKPIVGDDLQKIARIESAKDAFSSIQVQVIADGNAKSYEMAGITGLKVGKRFIEKKQQIICMSSEGVENVAALTGISQETSYSGAAGGLLFGIEQLFHPTYFLGGTYFSKLLSMEEQIEKADVVITGEGRFDNTACGKTPASVAVLARKYHKPVIFVCGQIARESVQSYKGGIVNGDQEEKLRELGIDQLLTCQEFYDSHTLQGTYAENIDFFREHTPIILKELFRKGNL